MSVDLAYTRSEDIGIVVLERLNAGTRAQRVRPCDINIVDPPSPAAVAQALVHLCYTLGASILLVDGPQAWKDPGNGLQHSRLCERSLNTPGKTGLPGVTKPSNYLSFITFSVSVFNELRHLGFVPYSGNVDGALAVESFPSSAWKQLELLPLPAKSRSTQDQVRAATQALRYLFGVVVEDVLTHDEVQALVAAFAGMALVAKHVDGFVTAGVPPLLLDGVWREGFIVNPTRQALADAHS